MDSRLRWFNEPAGVVFEGEGVWFETGAGTDFWQRTHYGFRADSGHFLFRDVVGDFECETLVRFHGVNQYDQAGLMVRVSADCWLKTSVEYEGPEPARLGAVVTNGGYSDWSTQDVGAGVDVMKFRVVRTGSDYLVYAELAGRWTQIRMARLGESREDGSVSVGLYACSPRGAGFAPRFEYLKIS